MLRCPPCGAASVATGCCTACCLSRRCAVLKKRQCARSVRHQPGNKHTPFSGGVEEVLDVPLWLPRLALCVLHPASHTLEHGCSCRGIVSLIWTFRPIGQSSLAIRWFCAWSLWRLHIPQSRLERICSQPGLLDMVIEGHPLPAVRLQGVAVGAIRWLRCSVVALAALDICRLHGCMRSL